MTETIPTEFTIEVLEWSPWLDRATETGLPEERHARVAEYVGSVSNSAYIDVLANDFEALLARALVHRHVYTSEEPQPSAYRELSATTASRINGCVFCASVHARMWANFAKDRETAIAFLAGGIETDLPEPERSIVDAAARLTTDPESLGAEHLESLRSQGFDDLAILDVLNYAAFFANANRLMLTLGEPRFRSRPEAGGDGS